MQKKYAKDDINVGREIKLDSETEEQIYQRLFRRKVYQGVNRRFPTTESKKQFLIQYLIPINCYNDNMNVEDTFNTLINIFIYVSFVSNNPFASFFDFTKDNKTYIANLINERNIIYNNFANYLQNNNGNEINNAIQQAQQNMENRLRDEETRFLNNQRIINNQVLQNARNEVENRANAFFQNQENQIQNQMNQIQDRANQFFNNEYRKYRDVLQQKHQLNKENEKLKAYNATLKKEHKEMNDLLKLNNKNYIYNRQNFDNLLRQNNVFKKNKQKNNSKSVLPKINNYVKNTRDSVNTYALPETKLMLKNLPNLNIKHNNQKFY